MGKAFSLDCLKRARMLRGFYCFSASLLVHLRLSYGDYRPQKIIKVSGMEIFLFSFIYYIFLSPLREEKIILTNGCIFFRTGAG